MPPSNNTTYTFRLRNKFSRAAREIRRSLKDIGKEFKTSSEKSELLDKRFKKVAGSAKAVAATFAVVSAAIVSVGRYAFRESARMETLNIAFRVLIGNAKLAKSTFEDLTHFAARTPFRLKSVAAAGKVMLAAGLEAGELTHRLRQLGEMSAASDRPVREFALIFAKIKGKNKIQGEELLQLAEKGVGISRELAKMFTKGSGTILETNSVVTEAMVFSAVEDGLVTHEHFLAVLDRLTSQGGRYFGLTDELSRSLGGLWSTVADNTDLAAAAFGDILVKVFKVKQGLTFLIPVLENLKYSMKSFSQENPTLTKFALYSMASVVALGGLLILSASVILIWSKIGAAVGVAWLAMKSIALLVAAVVAGLSPFTWLMLSIGGVFLYFKDFFQDIKNKLSTDIWESWTHRTTQLANALDRVADKFREIRGYLQEKFPIIFGSGSTEEEKREDFNKGEQARQVSTSLAAKRKSSGWLSEAYQEWLPAPESPIIPRPMSSWNGVSPEHAQLLGTVAKASVATKSLKAWDDTQGPGAFRRYMNEFVGGMGGFGTILPGKMDPAFASIKGSGTSARDMLNIPYTEENFGLVSNLGPVVRPMQEVYDKLMRKARGQADISKSTSNEALLQLAEKGFSSFPLPIPAMDVGLSKDYFQNESSNLGPVGDYWNMPKMGETESKVKHDLMIKVVTDPGTTAKVVSVPAEQGGLSIGVQE